MSKYYKNSLQLKGGYLFLHLMRKIYKKLITSETAATCTALFSFRLLTIILHYAYLLNRLLDALLMRKWLLNANSPEWLPVANGLV